jgi:hypothetical protein
MSETTPNNAFVRATAGMYCVRCGKHLSLCSCSADLPYNLVPSAEWEQHKVSPGCSAVGTGFVPLTSAEWEQHKVSPGLTPTPRRTWDVEVQCRGGDPWFMHRNVVRAWVEDGFFKVLTDDGFQYWHHLDTISTVKEYPGTANRE